MDMIRFEHVSYAYPDGTPALADISFSVAAGEQVGLIGANGAGKSTLMKAILGLITAEGRAEAAGLPVCRENLAAIRQKLGYVLQDSDNQLFMPTVLDDLMFGPLNYGKTRAEAEAAADAALTQLGVARLKNRRNQRMSGGEKRMAAIAAILTMEPEMLLMDEPSAALDPGSRRTLIRTLNALPQTKLIASHDLDLILETCDRVILIGGGRVAADGPAEEILRDRTLLESNSLELPFCLAGVPDRRTPR